MKKQKKERTSKCISFFRCVTKERKSHGWRRKKEERSKINQQFFSQNWFVSLINFQRFWPSHSTNWKLFSHHFVCLLPFPTKSEAIFSFPLKKSGKSVLARKMLKIKVLSCINVFGFFKLLSVHFVYVLCKMLLLSIFRAKLKIIFSLRNMNETASKQLEKVTEVLGLCTFGVGNTTWQLIQSKFIRCFRLRPNWRIFKGLFLKQVLPWN